LTAARRACALVACLALGVGCGLIEEATTIGFVVNQSVTMDAGQMSFPEFEIPAIPCAGMDMICCPTGDPRCAEVGLRCGGDSCEANIYISVASPVDVRMQNSNIKTVKKLADITLDKIDITVRQNSLAFDIPAMTLYLAPKDVSDPKTAPDPSRVSEMATIEAIPQGSTAAPRVTLTESGKRAFAIFASNAEEPFNFIATTTVKLAAGWKPPSSPGDQVLDLKISVFARAKPQF
jgi:hypothetical protein